MLFNVTLQCGPCGKGATRTPGGIRSKKSLISEFNSVDGEKYITAHVAVMGNARRDGVEAHGLGAARVWERGGRTSRNSGGVGRRGVASPFGS